MPKAKPHPDQFGFVFASPVVPRLAGQLAGLERQICLAAATILNSDSRSRERIAADMSELLGEEVSRAMLDAYASPARDGHKVPMSRFLALIAATNRHDVLDQLLRPIGAALLVGEEVLTARLGHVERQIRELQDVRKGLIGSVPLIRGGVTA